MAVTQMNARGFWTSSTNYPSFVGRSWAGMIGPFANSVTKVKSANPNWKREVGNGINATRPYRLDSREVYLGPANVQLFQDADKRYYKDYKNKFWFRTEGEFYYSPAAADLTTSNDFTLSGLSAENKAATALRDSIHEVDTKFEGATFVGTIFETWELLKHPGSALFGVLKNFESMAKRIIAQHTRGGRLKMTFAELHALLGGLWLEFSFGWRPLLSDVISLSEALADFVTSDTGIIRVTGHGSEEKSSVAYSQANAVVGNYSVGQCYRKDMVTVSERLDVNYTGGCLAALALSDGSDFGSKRLGLTFENFAPAVWELTPWSFLADYFLNIGDMINALTRTERKTVFLSKSIKMVKTTARTGSIVATGDSHSGGGDCGHATTIGTYFERFDAVESLPSVSFELNCPGVDSSRWINMMSLLRFK